MSAANKYNRSKTKSHDLHDLKPGSSAADAKKVGGSGDFGARADDENRTERDYVSANTKQSDPGHAQALSNEELGGRRVTGVGGRTGSEGASSGGDIDTDLVGFGDRAPTPHGKVGGDHSVKGSTITRPDARTLEGGADSATNAEGAIDNAFQGEVSSGEASGRDDRGE